MTSSAAEAASITRELPQPVVLRAPGTTTGLVVSIPHAGRRYPRAFLDAVQVPLAVLRRSEDAFVDELFEGAQGFGAVLTAQFPRLYLDVNREPYELDPALFDAALPAFANTRSLRVASGLGTLPRFANEQLPLYTAPLQLDAALTRVALLHWPYHEALKTALIAARAAAGTAVLLDCHSMPSRGIADRYADTADFVLGDRFGASCSRLLICHVEDWLRAKGYRVLLNKPYAGGYTTEHYGRPAEGVHALQIEISRSLYMNELLVTKTGNFSRLAQQMVDLVEGVASLIGPLAAPLRRAAE